MYKSQTAGSPYCLSAEYLCCWHIDLLCHAGDQAASNTFSMIASKEFLDSSRHGILQPSHLVVSNSSDSW